MEIHNELDEKKIMMERLFKTWRKIGNKVAMAGAIVQNDVKISKEQINEWTSYLSTTLSEMTVLADKTLDFVLKNMTDT